MAKQYLRDEIIVVKTGTHTLLGADGMLSQRVFDHIAAQSCIINNDGGGVVIVSSGAIQAGREEAGRLKIDTTRLTKKDLAGMGQCVLMNHWAEAFDRHARGVAQILVIDGNWQHEGERSAICSSILNWMKCRVIPIVNANDVISDREIIRMEHRISENDQLARMVAELIGGTGIVFVTHSGGVYDKNPRVHPDARLFSEVDHRTILYLRHQTGETDGASATGTGGIGPKLHAAVKAREHGLRVAIVVNDNSNPIVRFARGEAVNTIVDNRNIFAD